MQIRTRLTGFFLLTLTVWSLFLVWVNLEFYRRERSHFLQESFNQRLHFLVSILSDAEQRAAERQLEGPALSDAQREALVRAQAADFPNFSDGYPMIFDTSGKVLYRPAHVLGNCGLPPDDFDVERLRQYGFGDFNLTLPDGTRRQVICALVPGWNWVVYYSFPEESASWREVAEGARTRLGMTAIGSVLLSAVGLFFLIRRTLRPIERLGTKAEHLAGGSFPPPAKFYSHDELGALSRAFDEMSARLRRSYEELKQANADNREVRNFLAAIFNSVDLLVVSVDRQLRVTFFNQSLRLYAGDSLRNGELLWNAVPFLRADAPALERQIADRVARERTAVRFSREGTDCWFDILTTPLTSPREPGTVVVLKNVTALIRQQEQLLQAQKLETVGTLTGGIAHDFNNVLAGIRGALAMVRIAPDNAEQVVEFTTLAENAVQRAAGMVNQLLALARKTPFARVRTDWRARIDAVLAIARTSFHADTEIIWAPPEEPAWIDADPTQMEQVILNLLVNADQAIRAAQREHGRITIELRHDRAEWELAIGDNGSGIPPELRNRIFDPFFSTRVQGKGTGLGLAMVYAIIDRHAGKLAVESTVGTGSRFTVRLASAAPPADGESGTPEASPTAAASAERPGAAHTILLVDDEEMIRRSVSALLARFGYRVLTAADGAEALELFDARANEIELAILDMAMPGMGGDELFAALRKRRVDLPVWLHTGYPDDPRVEAARSAGVRVVLVKPTAPETLKERLAQFFAAS